MSRFSKLISDLEDLHQQDIKDTARVFGITATLYTRLQDLLNDLSSKNSPARSACSSASLPLPEKNLDKSDLIALYGNFNNAYRAYKSAYNIKPVRGWDGLLRSIRGLQPPSVSPSLEQRVETLEKTVKVLLEILSENTRPDKR
jgi:hypothetical protein